MLMKTLRRRRYCAWDFYKWEKNRIAFLGVHILDSSGMAISPLFFEFPYPVPLQVSCFAEQYFTLQYCPSTTWSEESSAYLSRSIIKHDNITRSLATARNSLVDGVRTLFQARFRLHPPIPWETVRVLNAHTITIKASLAANSAR